MSRPSRFKELPLDTAFSPHSGVGAGFVYVKKVNGVCPKVGTKEEGIFYPDDLVHVMKVPVSHLKPYLEN